jgi:diguanylate cyclase (GGDEF)-like protein
MIRYLRRQSRNSILAIGIAAMLLIGLIDYLVPPEIGLSILYLIPISIITWFTEKKAGLLIALGSATIWLFVNMDYASKTPFNIIHFWSALVHFGFFITVVFLQSALKNARMHARTDPLTGAGNRMHFIEQSAYEINRAARYGYVFSVAYMDIDNFKTVNDTFGHQAGDTLLKTVIGIIEENIRATDAVFRLGGDEFALLLPATDADAARKVFMKIRERLTASMKEHRWPVSFSIGAITFVSPPDSAGDLMQKADALMYSVKKSTKDAVRHEVFTGPNNNSVTRL